MSKLEILARYRRLNLIIVNSNDKKKIECAIANMNRLRAFYNAIELREFENALK